MWTSPYGEWGTHNYFIASCDQSLNRFGQGQLDANRASTTPLGSVAGAVESKGKRWVAGVQVFRNCDRSPICRQRSTSACPSCSWVCSQAVSASAIESCAWRASTSFQPSSAALAVSAAACGRAEKAPSPSSATRSVASDELLMSTIT